MRRSAKKRLYRASARFFAVLGMAVLIIGVLIAWHDWRANQAANQQAAKLVNQANQGLNHSVPSTTKLTESAFNSYTVAPSLPRYIFIPNIGVKAIVRPLGLAANGQIATPDNVFDTGWYKASSKPGQPGAMLIDGHISSWTTNGVFYSLKNLKTGNLIKIQRGDGTVITYSVVRKQVYNYQNVDMTAVLSPVTSGKPGLNLITCTGDVIKGTNEFNQRVVVFAQQT